MSQHSTLTREPPVEAAATSSTGVASSTSSGGSRVQSLDRALDILEALAAAGSEIGVSDLSERVGLHVSTVHRLLSVLVSRGYARQNAPSGRYTLGSQLLRLATGAVGGGPFDVRLEARPALQELAAASGETVNLVLLIDDQVVYVDQVLSQRRVRMFTQTGTRAPLYCTACGKALLAYRRPDELDRYLRGEELRPQTPNTIITAEELRMELARIRERGYAIDRGETELEVQCVAAPIFDHTGSASAAISISGPTLRFDLEHIQRVAPALVRVAADLSARLGYTGVAV